MNSITNQNLMLLDIKKHIDMKSLCQTNIYRWDILYEKVAVVFYSLVSASTKRPVLSQCFSTLYKMHLRGLCYVYLYKKNARTFCKNFFFCGAIDWQFFIHCRWLIFAWHAAISVNCMQRGTLYKQTKRNSTFLDYLFKWERTIQPDCPCLDIL